MPDNSTLPAAGKLRKKRQFPFGLVAMAIGASLGCWGGIAMTKKAMTGPVWVQKIFGLPQIVKNVEPPVPPKMPEAKTIPTPISPVIATPDLSESRKTAEPKGTNSASNRTIDIDIPEPDRDQNPAYKAQLKDIMGTWEVSDKLVSGGKSSAVVSGYLFKEDETGEFSSDGKKLYDFRWFKEGDGLRLQFDGDAPEGSNSWEVKMKWSLNADRSLLTLIPHGGKDPRAVLYGSGPGVFHKK